MHRPYRLAIAMSVLLVSGCSTMPVEEEVAEAPAATPTLAVRPAVSAEVEKKVMPVLDDMYSNQRRGMMNVPRDDGRLLRLLVQAMNAQHVVEIGTSNGYSGIWICLGLRATGGKLTTFDIDRRRADLALANFKRAGVDDIATLVFGNAHETYTVLKDPIDILFLDADKSGYMDYMDKILPLVRPGGLVIAHNTSSHGSGMKDYLNFVTTDERFETLFLHKDKAGMGVTMKKR